jgi:hypothetical protein
LARDGRLVPLNFRTNWRAAARISSSVAGGSKFARVLIFRHIGVLLSNFPQKLSKTVPTLCRPFLHIGLEHTIPVFNRLEDRPGRQLCHDDFPFKTTGIFKSYFSFSI